MSSTASRDQTLSIVSVIIGAASLLCGFALFPPLIGLAVALQARRREPFGRTIATWGMGLNLLMLFGWLIALIVLVVTGTLAVLLQP